ncbi:F390 synthetase-related protein [Paenibacillus sp. FSL K6-1096]|uniref:F390 synthetase-related protein n=1 Tax=Paenibacillus sp. FSL K6-1096 TaxID=2921460 RepID=UPI0030EDEFE9
MKRIRLIITHYVLTRWSRRWKNRAALEQWQEKRIRRHVDKVRQRSKFYRELWAGIPAEEWRSFPIIGKTQMMDNFDQLNTAGITKEQAFAEAYAAENSRNFKPTLQGVTVGLSSGTSGNRGIFLVDEGEQAAWTGTVLAKLLPGGLWQRARIAFFLRANSNLYESVKQGRLQFRYFDLLEPLPQLLARMNEYQPDIWIAPPSMLRLLAEAHNSGTLKLRPRRMIAVAEVLDPLDRQQIEQTFGQKVHQAYQCTEGFLGATCSHGTLHLNEDIVHIDKEPLDEASRRFVPVITDFSRTVQPIIRYRLNDILTEAAEPCPCGSLFTAIERIEGRCDDILYLPHTADGTLVTVFPDFITRAVLAASADIEHYRVIQHSPEELEVSYRTRTGTDEATEQQITRELERLFTRLSCTPPQLTFTAYSFEPGSRKLRRVERGWKP